MSSTISTSLTHGITLISSNYANPLTISGQIDAATGAALFAEASWDITNTGSIFAAQGEGVFLKSGGIIDNSGTIQAPAQYGVWSTSNAPTAVENSGYIDGGKVGILLLGNSVALDNEIGGTIAGAEGLKFHGSGPTGGSLMNAGTITSSNLAVNGGAGLYLVNANGTNASTGVISGGSVGVKIANPSEFTNFGTITGETGIAVGANQNSVAIIDGGTINAQLTAVSFYVDNIGDSLTLLPGAVLHGLATGGGSADLVFGGTIAATMATVGHELTLFSTISVADGASWDFSGNSSLVGQALLENDGMITEATGDTLSINSNVAGSGTIDLNGGTLALTGNVAPSQVVAFQTTHSAFIIDQSYSFSGEIAGYAPGDTIEITGFGATETVNGTQSQSGTLFNVTANGKTETFTFATDPGPLTLVPMGPTSGVTKSYEFAMNCFCAGTRLLTPQGPRAVERLTSGDLVVTHDGTIRPIIWHGHRRVDCKRHPNPETVLPILIEEGAFAPGVPARDLYLSPDHAIYCENVLVQAKHLINDISIRQVNVADVTYHHIELETHDVVWAETLPTETYLDCGNRQNFSRQKGPVALHANFAAPQWDAARACAPLVAGGPILTAIRSRIHDRLLDSGVSRIAGSFSAYADGQPLEPSDAENGQTVFRLPAHARHLILESSAARPADMDPASHDRRRLGIAMTDITIDGQAIDQSSNRFGTGFHLPETRGRRWFRWTMGRAIFDVTDVREVAFTVQAISPKWQRPAGWSGCETRAQHAWGSR